MQYIIIGAVAIAIAIYSSIVNKAKKHEKLKRIQEERNERQDYIYKFIQKIEEAVSDFKSFIEINNKQYFSYSLLERWKNEYDSVLTTKLKSIKFQDLEITSQQKDAIRYFQSFANDPDSIRIKRNNNFLEKELLKSNYLLSDVDDGKSLDSNQREAIIRDEDNSLVIAGAGCGKTTTIMGKVKYLTERLAVPPEQILLISFTKKSANDLVKKVNTEGITASTFHKLGLEIIKSVEGSPPSIYDQSSQVFIQRTFKNLLAKDEYLQRAVEYFTDYIRIEKDDFQIDSFNEHIQHLKDQNYRPYKQKRIERNGRETYLREIVKSQEECKIANWLLFNGLKYEYEYPYEVSTRTPAYRQYAPDFTLFQNDKKVYLEHYGIDRNGNVPPFFANESTTLEEAKIKYNEGIEWKRNLHKRNRTICLESFSFQFQDKSVFKSLSKQLEENGFEITELSNEQKWKLIDNTASDEIKGLTRLFNTFLSLYKSNNLSFETLKMKIESLTGFERERTVAFINLFNPILWAYEKMLKEREQIDFSDMINHATNYINNGKYESPYRYIVVDEFQDISYGRYNLLLALKNQSKTNKLFAVGDDWQSIFRFTGSDIGLFNDFDNYFGYTHTTKIEKTYRFGQPLIDIAGNFVMKNPNQIEKTLSTPLRLKTDVKTYYSRDESNDDSLALKEAIDEIIEEIREKCDDEARSIAMLSTKSFFVLGRYNFDIDRINFENNSHFAKIDSETIKYQYSDGVTISLKFLTVHRSKGLEADFVFILNCNSGKIGFPSEIADDPVLGLILKSSDNYENSEERRLFYVALSRAKEKAVCISNSNFTSKFVLELEEGKPSSVSKKCPRCKSGDLILKQGTSANGHNWAFESCSNYAAYNCDYKEWK